MLSKRTFLKALATVVAAPTAAAATVFDSDTRKRFQEVADDKDVGVDWRKEVIRHFMTDKGILRINMSRIEWYNKATFMFWPDWRPKWAPSVEAWHHVKMIRVLSDGGYHFRVHLMLDNGRSFEVVYVHEFKED